MTETCYICWKRAVGEAWSYTDDEWKPLCRVCLDRENPDKWEPYDEEEDNEG